MKMELTNSKILIVDDQEANVRILESLLEIKGFKQVKSTTDSRQVEDLVQSFCPDLLLLDLMMPKKDGFDVLTELKEQKSSLPVIVSTNLSQESDIAKAKKLGAKDFFVKSDTPINKVVEHVKKLLE